MKCFFQQNYINWGLWLQQLVLSLSCTKETVFVSPPLLINTEMRLEGLSFLLSGKNTSYNGLFFVDPTLP